MRSRGDSGPDSEARCRVCGVDAAISFEHLSPKAAHNSSPARVFGLSDWLGRGTAGPHTLCDDCIEVAAEWYLPEFREWSQTAARAIAEGASDGELDAGPSASWTTIELFEVRPARFLKQVVTMLLAIAPAGFVARGNGELAEYARDPERTRLPPDYQLYLTLYRGPNARFVGYSARLDVETGRTEELLELAYPPFSSILSLGGDAAIESSNITAFADLRLDDVCVVDLDLLNGFGHTPYPADFRTLAAVERDRAAERRVA